MSSLVVSHAGLPAEWHRVTGEVKQALCGPPSQFAEALHSVIDQLLVLIDLSPEFALSQVVRQPVTGSGHYGVNHSIHAATACHAAARQLGWVSEGQLTVCRHRGPLRRSRAARQGGRGAGRQGQAGRDIFGELGVVAGRERQLPLQADPAGGQADGPLGGDMDGLGREIADASGRVVVVVSVMSASSARTMRALTQDRAGNRHSLAPRRAPWPGGCRSALPM